MKTFIEFINEDAPVNATGAAVAGTTPNETPPVSLKRQKKYVSKNKKTKPGRNLFGLPYYGTGT